MFDTDDAVLRKTAASVFAQDAAIWRWVICDNGSKRRGTRSVLRKLARHPNVVVESLPQNVGMVAGHRRGLELCTADYVALLDHDDVLAHDAMCTVAWHIDRHNSPAFLYSDEDKCDIDDRHFDPLLKPDFSPALLRETAYTCHLSVVKRTDLIASEAFTDAAVEGTQDWDMALRIFESGADIVHIPEILYSWRASPNSTAQTLSSKPYVLGAQRACLQHHLQRCDLIDRFEVIPNPMFLEPEGHWRIRRRAEAQAPSVTIMVAPGRVPIGDAEFIAYLPDEHDSPSSEWLREATGLLELTPDAGLVGAPHPDEPVEAHFRWSRRDATAYTAPWVARAAAFADIGPVHTGDADVSARLRSAGWRTIVTPHLLPTPG